jgi:hypothetical protein
MHSRSTERRHRPSSYKAQAKQLQDTGQDTGQAATRHDLPRADPHKEHDRQWPRAAPRGLVEGAGLACRCRRALSGAHGEIEDERGGAIASK